jgi:hypothetical protein
MLSLANWPSRYSASRRTQLSCLISWAPMKLRVLISSSKQQLPGLARHLRRINLVGCGYAEKCGMYPLGR